MADLSKVYQTYFTTGGSKPPCPSPGAPVMLETSVPGTSARRPLWPEPLEAAAATGPAPSALWRAHVGLNGDDGRKPQPTLWSATWLENPSNTAYGGLIRNSFRSSPIYVKMFTFRDNEVGHFIKHDSDLANEMSMDADMILPWWRHVRSPRQRRIPAWPRHPREQDRIPLLVRQILLFILRYHCYNILYIYICIYLYTLLIFELEHLEIVREILEGRVSWCFLCMSDRVWWGPAPLQCSGRVHQRQGPRLTRSSDHQRIPEWQGCGWKHQNSNETTVGPPASPAKISSLHVASHLNIIAKIRGGQGYHQGPPSVPSIRSRSFGGQWHGPGREVGQRAPAQGLTRQ